MVPDPIIGIMRKGTLMNDNDDQKTGTFWHIPYDWRKPTRERFAATLWNRTSDQIIMPKVYGWGYDLNLHALLRRMRLIRSR